LEHYFISNGPIIGVRVFMDISNLEQSDTQIILCLFLAQNENPAKPHEQLGFKTAQGAFEEIGELFQKKENTVKNQRDAFDFYTDGPRVGWKNTLPQNLQLIFDSYGDLSRKELLKGSLDILAKQRSKMHMAQSNIFDVVATLKLPTKLERPDAQHNVSFSNSKSGSDQRWYSMSVKQILQCLEDYKKPEFQSINTTLPYSDNRWRNIYKKHFSDKVMQTLAAAQGSSTYSLLAKLIQAANAIPINPKRCQIDVKSLDITIARINNDMANFVGSTSSSSAPNPVTPKTGGRNIIFYGPPGTGKSNQIKTKTDKSPHEITVFHSDMQNSDFIGALKPAVEDEKVTYKFSPGPFAKALLKAYEHPDKDVYLVIEELNRAPAMSVFGELFQLLDREVSGASEYGVGFPSDEFREWLDHKTSMVHVEIRLPSNLSIYASMNTADQGVYPLDTAFRRRWDDEYICIDWDRDDCPEIELYIVDVKGIEKETSWKLLGSAVNKVLLENNYPEDRLLGQWWINKKDVPKGANTVPNKLLNYLWNDLLRHDEPTRHEIFKSSIKSFSMLIRQNTKDLKKQIFSDEFLKKLVS
jgi:5-methylcytosine-specific restriction enzyme B